MGGGRVQAEPGSRLEWASWIVTRRSAIERSLVLRLGDGCFAGHETGRCTPESPNGPGVVDVAAVDGRLKRAGVYDDCSSQQGGIGLWH